MRKVIVNWDPTQEAQDIHVSFPSEESKAAFLTALKVTGYRKGAWFKNNSAKYFLFVTIMQE